MAEFERVLRQIERDIQGMLPNPAFWTSSHEKKPRQSEICRDGCWETISPTIATSNMWKAEWKAPAIGFWIGPGFKTGLRPPFQMDIPRFYGSMVLRDSESPSCVRKSSITCRPYQMHRSLISFLHLTLKEKIPMWQYDHGYPK